MSTIESILTRAMNETTFADLLFNDLDKALAGYDLTAEEYAKLKSLSRVEFEALAMEERKSMAYELKSVQITSYQLTGSG